MDDDSVDASALCNAGSVPKWRKAPHKTGNNMFFNRFFHHAILHHDFALSYLVA
nr:hypothetical protein [Halomonas socia]